MFAPHKITSKYNREISALAEIHLKREKSRTRTTSPRKNVVRSAGTRFAIKIEFFPKVLTKQMKCSIM